MTHRVKSGQFNAKKTTSEERHSCILIGGLILYLQTLRVISVLCGRLVDYLEYRFIFVYSYTPNSEIQFVFVCECCIFISRAPITH